MHYLLFSIFLAACALPTSAQTTPGATTKDISLQNQEELRNTAAALEEAIKTLPGTVEVYIKLGFTYTRLGKADEAQKAFEAAISLVPGKAIAHYMLGLIYEKKGLTEKAVTAWKACLENASEAHIKETAIKHLNNLAAK